MSSQNKALDDISKLMINAVGVAQGAKSEAESVFSTWFDRWLTERNLVLREEFDAVSMMAARAREENEALKSRIEALETAIENQPKQGGARKPSKRKD